MALDAEVATDMAAPLSEDDAAANSLDVGEDDEELMNDFEEEVGTTESEAKQVKSR